MDEFVFTLYSVKGIGPVQYRKLIGTFGNAKNVIYAPLSSLKDIVPEMVAIKIKELTPETIVLRKKLLNESNIKCIDYTSPEFPEEYKGNEIFPPVIFLKGHRVETMKRIAIVGTRKPTQYGINVTRQFVEELVERGFSIVSGGARGIDTIAHKTALSKGGNTVAILGCGLDISYPPENKNLFNEIAKTGTLLSEFPPGTKPYKDNFPKRNRLIAGLSQGVLIVEAGEKSGALITAKWALEFGKEVYVVPGPINSFASVGTNKLIKEGAKAVTTVNDILEDFGISDTRPFPKKEIQLTPIEERVLNSITQDPIHFDELQRRTNYEITELLSTLFDLEIKGLIIELPGKFYKRG